MALRLFAAFLAFLLFAAPAAAAAEEFDKVVLQLKWRHQFQFAGYYAAVEKGYYAEAGFDVSLRELRPEMDYVDEVLSGRADYGIGSSYILLRRLQGDPLIALAAIFQHAPDVILTLKESGITTPQQIAGKRLLVSPSGQALISAVLIQEGVDLNSVKFVDHTKWRIDALQSGLTDAFGAYTTNELYFLERAGVELNVIQPRAYGIDFYADVLFTSRDMLKKFPERTARFVAASLKGWKYAMSHPEEIIDIIVSDYHPGKSREQLVHEAEAMSKLILPNLVEIGHMNRGRWKHMAEVYSDLGMAQFDGDLGDFIFNPALMSRARQNMLWRWLIAAFALAILVAVVAMLWARTLRRLVEKKTRELDQSEKRFRSVFDDMPLLLAIWKKHDGHFVLDGVNRASSEVSGSRINQFLGTPLVEFYKDDPELIEAVKRCHQTGEMLHEERSYKFRSTGDQAILSMFFARISDEEVLVVSEDITERKQAEALLEQRNIELELAQRIAVIGNWSLDPEAGVPEWSELIYEIYERDPALGPYSLEDYEKVYQGEHLELFFSSIHQAVKDGVPYEIELYFKLPDGRGKWVHAIGRPSKVKGSKGHYLQGTIQDITERKQAEQSLRQSEELLRMAQRIAKVGGWSRELSTGRTYWTAEHYRLLGYEPGELEPTKDIFMSHVHPEDKEYVSGERQAAIEGIRDYDAEYRFIRKDGQERYGRTVGRAELAHDGTAVFLYGAFQDITKSKMIEKQLKDSLRERESMLLEIHHRVKNNLQIILGLLDMSRYRAKHDEALEVIREIHGKISSIALIHTELYREERLGGINITQYARKLAAQLRKLYEKTGVELDFNDTGVDLGLERAVPMGLVLNELMTNAFKYAFADGSGKLSCRAEIRYDKICLHLSDDGPGLSDEIDPFTAKTLGFKLVRDIVEMQLKGELEINSDNGTKVSIVFPVDASEES